MGWTELQSKSTVAASGNPTVTPTTALSSGSKLIVWVSNDVNVTGTITSVKDAAGNTFTQGALINFGSSQGTLAMYFLDTPAGDVGATPVITVTLSSTFGCSVLLQEVSGLLAGNTTACLDGTAAVLAGSATPATAAAYTSSAANEFLAAAIGDAGWSTTYTETGFTADPANPAPNGSADLQVGTKNSAGGSESLSWAWTGGTPQWGTILVAFKLAIAGTPQSRVIQQQRKPRKERQQMLVPSAAVVGTVNVNFTETGAGSDGFSVPVPVAFTDSGAGSDAFSIGPPYITGLAGASGGNPGYFVDNLGTPRLLICDNPWAIIPQAGTVAGSAASWQSDMDNYLVTRAAQGVNGIYLSPYGCGNNFCTFTDGRNINGEYPFASGSSNNPSSGLNNTFWLKVDHFLTKAQSLGITVLMNIGYSGGTADMDAGGCLNGKTSTQYQDYGAALAARYAGQPNLIWIVGNDYFGSYDSAYSSILTGLRGAGDTHLIAIHNNPETTSRFDLSNNSVMAWGTSNTQFNFLYSYDCEYLAAEYAYAETSPLLVFQGDGYYYQGGSTYLGGTSFAYDRSVRQELWWSLSSGARGHNTGDEGVWKWPSTAQSQAATGWFFVNNIGSIRTAVEGLSGWQNLKPATGSTLVTAGRGTRATQFTSGGGGGQYEPAYSNSYVSASITPTGSLALMYLPNHTTITIDESKVGGAGNYTAKRMDPITGAATTVTTGSTYNSTSWGSNSGGDPDWVLVLTSTASATTVPLTDTGAASDALAVAQPAPLTEAAAGSGSLAVTQPTPLTEAGAGTDSLGITQPAPFTDAGTGTDALGVMPGLTEAGAAADALALAQPTALTETGTGTTGLGVTAGLTETGTGTDTAGVSIPVSLTDAGAGAEALAEAAAVAFPEAGAGSGALAVTAGIPLAETGAGATGLGVMPGLTESGAGSDALGVTPGTDTYRLWPSTNGPAATVSYTGNFIAGTQFAVAGGGNWFQGYWWWVAPAGQSTSPVKCALWSSTGAGAGVLVPGSVVTSGTLTAGQWNYIPLTAPLQLAPSYDANYPSNGSAYVAAVGVNGNFPDTGSYWGSGQPGGNGIVNGPLMAYSAFGGTKAVPSMSQGVFSTTGSDPAVQIPNAASGTDNFWVDVQVTTTAPAGDASSKRLWPNKYDANPMTVLDLNVAYTIATEVDITQPAVLNNVWFYSMSGSADLPTAAAVWDISSQAKVASITSPSWSGAAGSGWVSAPFSGVTLPPGSYRVSVYNGAGTASTPKDASTGYFDLGVAASGIDWGIIKAPSLSNAAAGVLFDGTTAGGAATPHVQPPFAMPPGEHFPNQWSGVTADTDASNAVHTQNYWVDLEVTAVIPVGLAEAGAGADALGTAVPVALTQAGAAAEALAVTQPTAFTEAGTGTTGLGAIPVFAEAGAGTDTLAASQLVSVPLTDAGTGADALAALPVIPLPEAGTGTDTLGTAPGLTEAGSGTGTLSVVQPTGMSEPAAGSDGLGAIPGFGDAGAGLDSLTASQLQTVNLTDTGAAADALAVQSVTPVTLTDTGAGTDALNASTMGVTLTEPGAGSDVLAFGPGPVTLTDTGTGTTTLGVTAVVTVPLTESGTGTVLLATAFPVPLADTGHAVDALAAVQALLQPLTGLHAGAPHGRWSAGPPRDTGIGTAAPHSRWQAGEPHD